MQAKELLYMYQGTHSTELTQLYKAKTIAAWWVKHARYLATIDIVLL